MRACFIGPSKSLDNAGIVVFVFCCSAVFAPQKFKKKRHLHVKSLGLSNLFAGAPSIAYVDIFGAPCLRFHHSLLAVEWKSTASLRVARLLNVITIATDMKVKLISPLSLSLSY